MAVFLINTCKFNGCGITFPSLNDLIQHIEDTHIDYESLALGIKEKSQSTCLPLSYVLRFINDSSRKETSAAKINGVDKVCAAALASNGSMTTINHSLSTCATGIINTLSSVNTNNAGNETCNYSGDTLVKRMVTPASGTDLKRKIAIKHHSYSMSSVNRSSTPTGSEMDDDDIMGSESEDSNDSWTTEEFSSEFIMRYGSRRHSSSGGNGLNSSNEKPFACPVPGCKKRYKNVNGIKYHSKNGHKKDGNRVRKGYKCHCGKSYKTSQRLKNHNIAIHSNGVHDTSNISYPPSTLSTLSPAAIPNICSSISTNAINTNNSSIYTSTTSQIGIVTSPTITITHLTHKVPRVLAPVTVTSSSMATLSSTVATAAVIQASMPNSTSSTVLQTPLVPSIQSSNGKYDNLGILTPATSPKLTLLTGGGSQENLVPISPSTTVINSGNVVAIVSPSVVGPIPSDINDNGLNDNVVTVSDTGIAGCDDDASGGCIEFIGNAGASTGISGGTTGNKSSLLSPSIVITHLHTEET